MDFPTGVLPAPSPPWHMAHLALNVAAPSSARTATPHTSTTAKAAQIVLQTFRPILFERMLIVPPASGKLDFLVRPALPSFQNAYRSEKVPLLPSKSRSAIGDTPNGLLIPVSL